LFFLKKQGSNGTEDCIKAIKTLGEILLTMSKLMAPFTPFFSGWLSFSAMLCSVSLITIRCRVDLPADARVRGCGVGARGSHRQLVCGQGLAALLGMHVHLVDF
jgi:hypothetical protein